jgi:hypothetical protein
MTEEEFFMVFADMFKTVPVADYFLWFAAVVIGASAIAVGCVTLSGIFRSWTKRKGS